jgi:broad specificity phosphatase PhoE
VIQFSKCRLWLVRHGQTDWNAQGLVQGQTPTSLNAEGFREAQTLADYFAGRPFVAVFSSDLPRAAQTAQAIADRLGLSVEHSTDLRERSFGRYEGFTARQVREARAALGLPQTGDLSDWTGMPNIESNEAVWQRASAALQRISDRFPDQDVVVVTHGGVMARAVYRVLEIDDRKPRRFALSNGIVVVLQQREGDFHLLSLVDVPLIFENQPSIDTATMSQIPGKPAVG